MESDPGATLPAAHHVLELRATPSLIRPLYEPSQGALSYAALTSPRASRSIRILGCTG